MREPFCILEHLLETVIEKLIFNHLQDNEGQPQQFNQVRVLNRLNHHNTLVLFFFFNSFVVPAAVFGVIVL